MSVIQKIQEKYAKLMAIIIAVALMIFVVMLAFENGGSLFRGGNSTTVGKVNGTSIDYNDFMKKVEQQEKNLEAQYAQMGMPTSGLQPQAIESAWNAEVNDIIQQRELDKLGIRVGKKEMGDILYGPNAPDQWKRLFMRSDSDRFDGIAAKAQIDQMLKSKAMSQEQADQREQLIAYINSLQQQRLDQKLTSLLSNSVNFPKWFIEKQIADESQMASISIVRDNIAEHASDSTIKVSDKEIQDYIDKHKEDYKQEESRSIAYVSFSTKPSAADSAAARKKVEDAKAEFDTTTNVASFLSRAGSATPYSETYAGKSLMQMPNKDTIQKIPVNGVFGPYFDGRFYAMAKMLDIKMLPDSVKCRHILLGVTDRSGQPIMEDSVAHKKADSIALAIKNGAKFDSLEAKYTTDQVAHKDKGVMTFSSDQIQGEGFAKEFGQFILFDGKPGDKKVIKTQFGWHYIEILNFIKVEPHYKVAYMSAPVESSTETEINANNDANQFAANSRDQKSFDANAEKLFKERGISRMVANEIQPSAQQVPGLSQPRALVRKVYDAKLGEVLEPQKAGDSYVVAIVTEINKEGTQSVAKARSVIDPILRNKKIAEKIIQKIGNITTLEAAAAALGGKAIEQADSLRMIGTQSSAAMRVAGITSEPKVIGAAFNPSNKGKVVPQAIEGRGAVYVVRVNDVSATPVANANVAAVRQQRYQAAKPQVASPVQALRVTAKIKDRRVNFF